MFGRIAVISLMFGFGLPALAMAAEPVSWFLTHFPPGYIRSGDQIGTGHMDRMLVDFQKSLSGFEHRTVDGPLTRIMASMKKRDGVCSNGLFKTAEREKFIAFSKPYLWIVSNRLIVADGALPKVQPHINPDGAVHVDSLLADPSVQVGYVRARAYASGIDAQIAALKDSPRGHAAIHSETLMKMVAGRRFDVTFAYPTEATYHLRRLGLSPTLRYFPIASLARFFPVYVGCADKPLGRRVVDEVNKLIDAAGDYPAWYAHYEKNLNPDTVKELRAHVPTTR